jgi:hypothetical protein
MITGCKDQVVYEAPSSVVMEVSVSGQLAREDYEDFESEIERILVTQDKVRLLLLVRDVDGWTAGTVWEDVKFGAKHFTADRIAIVGESKWEHVIASFYKPFSRATIQFLDRADEQAARTWISSP